MKRLGRFALAGATAALLAACGGGGSPGATDAAPSAAADERVRALAASQRVAVPSRLAMERAQTHAVLDSRLKGAKGPQRVWVTLADPSLAAFKAAQLEAAGLDMQARSLTGAASTDATQKSVLKLHRSTLKASQDALMTQLRGMGAQELARVHVAHNAIAIKVDASSLDAISRLSGVAKVRPVIDHMLDLSETVPYVGGAAVQTAGYTGKGVRVAVLDSGIDYTHKNLGGAGTLEAYAAAHGEGASDPKNTTRDGLFPTAKVVDGFDFVGEDWPNSAEAPDPDPIDFQGHGTHVADIIAGRSTDGSHKGMAPDASLLAVKVCSAVATSCSGIALLQGMDFAIDPNGDGDTSDAVDVINMSLGSPYGQFEDDLTLAAMNAVKLGVVVVTSAGNSANRPYITGSPSIGQGVISVAQTQTPSATAVPLVINAPASIAGVYGNTQTLDWAPVGNGVTGDVAFYGRGCPAGSVPGQAGADPVVQNVSGKVALIDRGGCSVSLKVDRAAKDGATGVIIGLVAPGDAVAFSFGGGDTFRPSLVIQQSLASAIKARLAASEVVNASITNAAALPLVGSVVASSSRGPSMSNQHIKPEIGAPGASISAEVGTGTGTTPFGGTSGAAPMVAGAAALLVEANPRFSPYRIKALLMNSAETVVYTNPALQPGVLAPITRVGAGELRVDRALKLKSLAWNRVQSSSALSFGAIEVARATTTTQQQLRVENRSDSEVTYTITPSFRFANDAASGAVTVVAPSEVTVPARGAKNVSVRLQIDPEKLASWTLNGGSQGGSGAGLDGPEYDGYITLTAGSEKLSVPWHVLPRRAAETTAEWVDRGNPRMAFRMRNRGSETGAYEMYSLLAVSPKLPASAFPEPGDNFTTHDIRAVGARYLSQDICGAAGGCMEFAVATYGRRAHPAYPGGISVNIDSNGDGVVDYFVYNAEVGGFNTSGQTGAYVQRAGSTTASVFFYADADLNSGNMSLIVPLGAIGGAAGTTLNFSVEAFDNYYSGLISDTVDGLRFTPAGARFNAVGVPFGSVPAKGTSRVLVQRASVDDSTTSELGLLIFNRSDAREMLTLRAP